MADQGQPAPRPTSPSARSPAPFDCASACPSASDSMSTSTTPARTARRRRCCAASRRSRDTRQHPFLRSCPRQVPLVCTRSPPGLISSPAGSGIVLRASPPIQVCRSRAASPAPLPGLMRMWSESRAVSPLEMWGVWCKRSIAQQNQRHHISIRPPRHTREGAPSTTCITPCKTASCSSETPI
jgi:hypothetical protein